MNWNTNKLIVLLLLNICTFSVHCQNVESGHNYDIVKSIQKSAEDINLSKSLKLISEEDKSFLNAFQDFLPNSIQPILIEMLSDSTTDKCVDNLKYVFSSLWPPAEWSMNMVDSYGKPDSGILLGNVKWFGAYDECLKVYAPPKGNTGLGDFHGKYCTLQLPLKFAGKSFPITMGVCLPDICNPNATFNGLFKNITTMFNLTGMSELIVKTILSNATITCQAKSRETTAGFFVVVFLLSIIVLLAVIGSSITALEHYLKARAANEPDDKFSLNSTVENDEALQHSKFEEVVLPAWLEKCKPFFNCFCIFTNGEKLLNTDGGEGQLPCLHGIRFLSMAWVIVCHGYLAPMTFIKNPMEIMDKCDNWPFQVIMNGFFSVDSFFVLSGFLVGYVYFKQAPKTDGNIPWLYFYIHRYIRLTPVYVIVMLFFACVMPYMGSGPLWPQDTVVKECKESWWWNILYINNFQSMPEECMGWSWYLANDMQFYIISPLFLITLYKWPKIGYSILGLFFCMTFSANFGITYEYNLVAGVGNVLLYANALQTFLPRLQDFMSMIYIKPYTRIGAYLVGIIVAYIVYKRKENNSGQLDTRTLGIGWILASGITLTCQFGLYHQKLSTVATCFYNALSRIGFSLGIGWVIFVCVIGQGDVVNSILSWKPLIPLSRLTYCAYLLHPIVQYVYFHSIRAMVEFTHINMIMLFFGTIFISYFAAFMTSLLFESPVIRLEKLLRNKLSP